MRNFLLLIVVVFVANTVIGDSRVGSVPVIRKPTRTLQVCRQDFKALCTRVVGKPQPRRTDLVDCLAEKIDDVKDETCKTWVTAESLCKKSANSTGKCTKYMSLPQCFAKIPSSDLPQACTDSDFYKALSTFSSRRRPIRPISPKTEG
mmetsp:Transcript_74707/g.86734  ORF Transcript_74707/g.86734 Transcript_74707/m.86734 type:complete len:148 (+) Transcript_74707:21-464(+)